MYAIKEKKAKKMTNEELDKLEELANKATPGPWKIDGYASFSIAVAHIYSEILIANTHCNNDAKFVAASREAIPKLIAEVRRLRKAIDDIGLR